MPEPEKYKFGQLNVANNLHIQRTLLDCRATIHCATSWKALDEIYKIYMFCLYSLKPRRLHFFLPRLQNVSKSSSKISQIPFSTNRISKISSYVSATLRTRARRVRAFFEARRERAAFLLVQTPALSPPLSLARFSVFCFRPSNLGLCGASLQTPEPEKNNWHLVLTKH